MKKLLMMGIVLLAGCGSQAQAPRADGAAGGETPAAGGSGGGPGSGGTPAGGGTGGSAGTGGTSDGASNAPSGGASASGGTSSAGGATAGSSGADAGSGGLAGATASGGRTAAGGSGAGGGAGAGGASDASVGKDLAPAEAGGGRDVGPDGTTPPLTVYVAGDSTVATYTNSTIHQGGWGQFLQDAFPSNAKIVNKAVGGMTARHFIEAGYLDEILSAIKRGDYLLVQFGTNDGNKTATYTLPGSSTAIPYYLAPQTDFKTYLTKYVDATKAKGATTIFVTPPPRHSCNAGEMGVRNGLGDYATAMKELGPTLGAPVVDLNAMTIAYLANISCETSGQTFYLVKADGSIDSTHFQENGAKIMAGLVAKGATGISTLGISLSAYVK